MSRIIKPLTEGKFKTNVKDVKGLKRNALPPPPARPIKNTKYEIY